MLPPPPSVPNATALHNPVIWSKTFKTHTRMENAPENSPYYLSTLTTNSKSRQIKVIEEANNSRFAEFKGKSPFFRVREENSASTTRSSTQTWCTH